MAAGCVGTRHMKWNNHILHIQRARAEHAPALERTQPPLRAHHHNTSRSLSILFYVKNGIGSFSRRTKCVYVEFDRLFKHRRWLCIHGTRMCLVSFHSPGHYIPNVFSSIFRTCSVFGWAHFIKNTSTRRWVAPISYFCWRECWICVCLSITHWCEVLCHDAAIQIFQTTCTFYRNSPSSKHPRPPLLFIWRNSGLWNLRGPKIWFDSKIGQGNGPRRNDAIIRFWTKTKRAADIFDRAKQEVVNLAVQRELMRLSTFRKTENRLHQQL